MKASTIALSIGSALAAGALAKFSTRLDVDDVLSNVGLTRRRSHWLEHLAWLGAGAAVGAGSALLLAPSSGQRTRAELSRQVERLGELVGSVGERATANGRERGAAAASSGPG